MSTFISVIIPVYNNKVGIKKVLEALLNQNYSKDLYEIIVVDNNSTDGTPSVVRRMAKDRSRGIRLAFEQDMQTSYAARNRGIRLAMGELLAFTDSDCVPSPNWLMSGLKALHEGSASCGGGTIEFIYQSKRPNLYEYLDSAGKFKQKFYVEQAGFAATANFFAYRSVFERRGMFNAELVSGGDYEFGRRLTGSGERMIFIPKALVFHPARNSFRSIYSKTVRVAQGQKQLSGMKLLEHGKMNWRRFLPARTWPIEPKWVGSLSHLDKLRLILLQSLLQWTNAYIRLR